VPKLSDKAIKLILEHEGMNQPGNWPGGDSGITLGIGYDLGYHTVDEFESDWGEFLTRPQLERLRAAAGLRGIKAKNRAEEFSDIKLKRTDAETVFVEKSLPQYFFKAQQAFPGFDNLPLDTQGALVSLVYNRGTSMVDGPKEEQKKIHNRREMRAIHDAVAVGDLQEIADQLRLMKRLWDPAKLGGLHTRRDAEATLVESTLSIEIR